MSKKIKVRITNDGVKGFFDRAREHARKLDHGEKLAPEMTISFENAADMMRVLSPQRVRVLRVARQGAAPVSTLASGLKRGTRAVSRLAGAVRIASHPLPGEPRTRQTQDRGAVRCQGPVGRNRLVTAFLRASVSVW